MTIITAIVLVALSRLLPHPPNFTCVGALALFAGFMSHRRMDQRWALALPLVALLVSDVLGHVMKVPGMGFYEPSAMLMVYAAFAGVVVLGRVAAGSVTGGESLTGGNSWSGRLPLRIGAASLAASTLFFLVSNLGVFFQGGYQWSLAGLARCYTAALPFFGNTIAGDLLFSALLFGSAALAGKVSGIGATLTEPAGRINLNG